MEYIVIGLIFITGIVTSITDCRYRKISNYYLISTAGCIGIVYVITFIGNKGIPIPLLVNVVVAVALGLLCYQQRIWRGGDAKLFILYALLMPATGYERMIPWSCITLFCYAFMAGALFLLPRELKKLIINRRVFFNGVSAVALLMNVKRALLQFTCIMWIVAPLLTLVGVRNPVIAFVIYFVLACTLREIQAFLKFPLNVVFLSTGVLLRILISPDFIFHFQWLSYVLNVSLFAFLSAITNQIVKNQQDSQDRIPFAPFLFMGTLLSYTPLTGLLLMLKRHI